MCFFIPENQHAPKVAKEDIICYKVIYHEIYHKNLKEFNKYLSLYESFEYKVGHTYVLKKSFKMSDKYNKRVNNGFHSYTDEKKACTYLRYGKRRVIKCIIPTGSLYWHNPDHEEYCSNQIMFKEVC